MKIDYNKLTECSLEQCVEFIDWSLVPGNVITKDIEEKFSSVFPALSVRIWFENILNSAEIRIDEEKYPDFIFFFKADKCLIEYNNKYGNLWCSYEYIWSIFYKDLGFNDGETQLFIKNVVEQHFKNKEITTHPDLLSLQFLVEQHFKNKEITTGTFAQSTNSMVEQHFKNKEITPICQMESGTILVEQHFKSSMS